MKLINFKYLQKQRFLTLTIILLLVSTLFSITALGFLGIYNSLNAYLGEEENIIAIYDLKSRAPFTGLVPVYLAERISSMDGVLATSPEVILPCLVNGKSIFLRGVVPDEFYKLNPITILNGKTLQLNDLNSAIVGKRLAKELNLAPNDEILAIGALWEQYIELKVRGIYESNTALDDEIIAPLYVGQWLRRTDYNHVTIIRVKIDRSKITPAQIYEALAQEAEAPQPSPDDEAKPGPLERIIPISRAAFELERLGVKEAREFMKTYVERYGMTKETLLILSIAVFMFTSSTIFASSYTLILQHKREIKVLRSIGASIKTMKLDLIIKTLPSSLAASLVGILIAAVALLITQEVGRLQVLSHRVQFQPDPSIVVINLMLISLIVILAIVRSLEGIARVE